jgi:hypothetical protein
MWVWNLIKAIWGHAEPAARFDWLIDRLGLRDYIIAGIIGFCMFIFVNYKSLSMTEQILVPFVAVCIILFFINQFLQFSDWTNARRSLHALNQNAHYTIPFFTIRRAAPIMVCFYTHNLGHHAPLAE